MSEIQAQPAGTSKPPARLWLQWLRRIVNTLTPLVLGGALLLSAWPRGKIEDGSKTQELHDDLVAKMRLVSLSQTWKMYAPDPSRGHFYMELKAYDAEGNMRVLEDSDMATNGWGTAWAWRRSRLDIWQHAVTRRIDKVNRNRTWYMRGVCLREARRGYDVQRLEMTRVYRRIRSPERVAEGASLLAKPRRRKAQDGSCRVRIIRDMIEVDRKRRERGDD